MATVELTSENFEQIMNESSVLFIDFWAEWCGPCKRFAPVFEAAAEKYPDIVFAKVNTEEQGQLAGMFGIRSIPTITVFREQIGIFSQPGAMAPAGLEELIGKVLELDMEEVRQKVAEAQAADAPEA